MANAQAVSHRMTLAEFLEWSPGDDRHCELVDGELVMMDPATIPHGDAVENIAGFLRPRLRPPCRINQSAGILADAETDSFFEADLAVSCEDRKPRQSHLEQPRLIVEVLSPSTKRHDLGVKLERYWQLPSVEDILFVSSTDRHVIHWRREGDSWRMRDVIGLGTVELALVPDSLDLDEIYRDIVF